MLKLETIGNKSSAVEDIQNVKKSDSESNSIHGIESKRNAPDVMEISRLWNYDESPKTPLTLQRKKRDETKQMPNSVAEATKPSESF